MHTATVTFDRIERATRVALRGRYLQLTVRTSDGFRCFLNVPGWPEVSEGMTVTAILDRPLRPEATARVYGWLRHDDHALLLPANQGNVAFGSLLVAGAGSLMLLLYRSSPERSSLTSLIPAIAFLSIGLAGLHRLWHSWQVAKQLRRLRAQRMTASASPPRAL